MGTINKGTQVVGRTVLMRRCEEIHSIVTPAKFPRKIGDRHHFDNRNSDAGELAQLFRSSLPRAHRGECSDMHLVNDLALQFAAAPLRIGPPKLPWIDNA